jgi:hypothetical protein
LEDDEDAAETPEDSSCLEWWEEAERKAEEKEDEMLEEKKVHAVRVESSPRGHGRVPAYSQFPVAKFAEVARIWKATADRRKAFEWVWSEKTEGCFCKFNDASSKTR